MVGVTGMELEAPMATGPTPLSMLAELEPAPTLTKRSMVSPAVISESLPKAKIPGPELLRKAVFWAATSAAESAVSKKATSSRIPSQNPLAGLFFALQ